MIEVISASGVIPSSSDIEKFEKYIDLLLEYNEKFNLTAITTRDDIILKHFTDSLFCSKSIKKGLSVADIGSGAGFPGLPLAIVRKDLNITLMDSLQKRVGFLNTVINVLSLSNVTAIHARAEEFGSNLKFRESFDVVTTRAVSNLGIVSEYSLPFVRLGGCMLAMRGRDPYTEINNGNSTLKLIKDLGGDVPQITAYQLPDSDIAHSIVFIKKLSSTPKTYPRRGKKLGSYKE